MKALHASPESERSESAHGGRSLGTGETARLREHGQGSLRQQSSRTGRLPWILRS